VIQDAIQEHFPGGTLLLQWTMDQSLVKWQLFCFILSVLKIFWDMQVEIQDDYADVGWQCIAHTVQCVVLDVLGIW